jgi:methyltransferase (TIGR04290 family)
MSAPAYNIVILGLSITSSWGNGHATTYRGLVRELTARGHSVLFLERDKPWYAEHRDLPFPPYGLTKIYASVEELKSLYADAIRCADLVVVGSFVPDGVVVGEWVTHIAEGVCAFYDIDTPATIAKMKTRQCDYLSAALVPRYDMYLSFTGGPILRDIQDTFGALMVRPLCCSADPTDYFPEEADSVYDLGYMGTYSEDRQAALDLLLLEPARRWKRGKFAVAGPQYPSRANWPKNVKYFDHLSPGEHRAFYASQRFSLNLTRADMLRAGYSPSVRLFEAAACATPVISDYWEGLETFFIIGEEILISRSPEETLGYLSSLSEEKRRRIGEKARRRFLSSHTAAHRAEELERYAREAYATHARRRFRGATLETQLRRPRTAVERKIAELGPWFHNLHLPDGAQTAPGHRLGDFPATLWQNIAPHIPKDVSGWNMLDIGCNAGFYCFELARRGARCTGVDIDEHYLRQARWAARKLGLEELVEFHRGHVYNLAYTKKTYDLVLFMGLFYHLRHPVLALDAVARKVKKMMIFQTLTMPGEKVCLPEKDVGFDEREKMLDQGWPKMAFIEKSLAGDPTNWWAPNHAAVEAMLRSSGFHVKRIGHEVYLCIPAFIPSRQGGAATADPLAVQTSTCADPRSFVDAQRELGYAVGADKTLDDEL